MADKIDQIGKDSMSSQNVTSVSVSPWKEGVVASI